MGKYQVQWWHDPLSFEQWVSVKSFIFQWRALRYISKRVVDNSFARKWRIVDTSFGAHITRIVSTVERVKEGDKK